MSLRTDFHLAFDEIAPSTGGLAERVVQTTAAEAPSRRRNERWMVRWRAPLGLVAALLLLALAVSALLSGSLLADWRKWSTGHSPQINQSELKSLEARPLLFPVVSPAESCPVSPLSNLSAHTSEAFMFGGGPVYVSALGYNSTTTNWGRWGSFDLIADPTNTSGLILIRAEDLQTGGSVVFAEFPYAAAGGAGNGIPTGRVVGSDVMLGLTEQMYPEQVLDTARPYPFTKKGEWPIFKNYMGIPKDAKGCIGFQIDGKNFTEWVVVSE
jgi:hypothetical protein